MLSSSSEIMNDPRPMYSGGQQAPNTRQQLEEAGLGMGKVPPQAVQLEEAVLGAMMLDKECVNRVIDILRDESFYDERNQKVYGAIFDLFNKEGGRIDLLTVAEQLRTRGELDAIGGPFYLSQLTTRVASSAHVEEHARIVSQKHVQRELIRVSSDIIRDSYDDTVDVFDLLDRAENSLFQVTEGNLKKNFARMKDVVGEVVVNIENARKDTDGVSGVPSGFVDLDRITGGWQRANMIVLAARPGMGKTAFVLSMARNMAVEFDIPVAVFSLEMSSAELVQRLVSSESGISGHKLRVGDLTDQEYQILHQRVGRLEDAPLFIDDTPGLSVFDFRAKCRRLKAQHGIQMVIIDYLQLMSGSKENKGNREQEISMISRSIKGIAKELDVPIIALSQLSRMVENRGGDKKPILSDLRESGAIEQDADIVSFIYRAEYYQIPHDEDGEPTENRAELIIAKNRHGSTETVKFKFIKHLAKFANLDSLEGDQYYASGGPMANLTPNTSFGQTAEGAKTITVGSRMNDMTDDDEGLAPLSPGEAPF